MNARTIQNAEVDRNMVDLLRVAIDRVESDPMAGTRKYSHTSQTRRTVAVLMALGLRRTDFSARVKVNRRTGEYSSCVTGHGSTGSDEVDRAITYWARELVEVGFTVHLGPNFAFMSTGGSRPCVNDYRDLKDAEPKYMMRGEE